MFTIDPKRLDLAAEFRAQPVGIHSPELQAVLTVMRSLPLDQRYILIRRKPYQEWVLAQLTGVRNEPPRIYHDKVYSSPEEAEWAIFKLRWHHATGEELREEDLP
ncbi:MAG: hypothetical protein SGJ07_07370 [Rhodospirillaceae bacterium]|nr:hypothetical protein [Rhodospirillaceae bacterium]